MPFWPRTGARGVARIEPSILADSLFATGIVGNEGLGWLVDIWANENPLNGGAASLIRFSFKEIDVFES